MHRLLPVVAGLAVTAVLVGSATLALDLGGVGSHPKAHWSAGADPADLARDADRSAGRADRGDARGVPSPSESPSESPSPSPSAVPSPPASPTPKPTTPPPTGGAAAAGSCKASYYETGSTTANGEHFDPDGLTAAHRTLKFNTEVRVTNQANGKSVVVRINDRGPFVNDRCIDLSRGAFKSIASLGSGVISIRYEVLS